MRELDARAVGTLGIPGPRLMEAAGSGAARLIARRWRPLRGRSVVVLCGKGNNGGDGFVVARRLRAAGARVRVFLLARRAEVRGDAAAALRRWTGRVEEVTSEAGLPAVESALAAADLVVDALLGTGLEGPARGLLGEVIARLDGTTAGARATRPVISLDLPSGLSSDRGALLGPTVRATLTTTFAGYKRSLLLHPAAARAGEIAVVPIGIPPAEVRRNVRTFLLEETDVRAGFTPRPTDAHKGVYGHLLVVAGSLGKTGAAALAARAALRSGTGLVTVATPASQQPVVAALGAEYMTEALPEIPAGSLARAAAGRLGALAGAVDALALGPGLSLAEETQALARELVATTPRPMVVDADALSALAGHLDILKAAAGSRLLTPHPGEMARMLGVSVEEVQADRIERARGFAVSHGVWLALKGAGTVVAAPDGRVWINPTGNPGMAKGGSGDVLTGMAGALLARGLDPLVALQAAVYLHGLAGDLARDAQGEEGMIAGDIVEAIPRALSPKRE
jgi:ADP-dependent NAD(P)H-hydrate dehydratase / NAD(P)H-hydrate epimerase